MMARFLWYLDPLSPLLEMDLGGGGGGGVNYLYIK